MKLIIEQQTNEMNTAWYVVGTSKELEDQGVVTHTGGLIGIGKTGHRERGCGQWSVQDR